MKPFASHEIAGAICQAERTRHLPLKEIGMPNYTRRQEINLQRCEQNCAKIRNFTNHLLETNSGLVIVVGPLFKYRPEGKPEHLKEFSARLKKLGGEVGACGLSENMIFAIPHAQINQAQHFVLAESVRNSLFTLQDGSIDIAWLAGRIRGVSACGVPCDGVPKPSSAVEKLARFALGIDRIVVAGIFQEARQLASGLEKLFLEVGAPKKRIDLAYHFTLDWETGQLLTRENHPWPRLLLP